MTKISVVTINYGTAAMTEKALRTLVASENNIEWEIILVDNKSSEELFDADFADLPVRIIRNSENAGFARAVNQGIAGAGGEYVLLLNSDVLVRPGCVSEMLRYLAQHPETGAVGPRLLFPDGRRQESAGREPSAFREFLRLSGLYRHFPQGTLLSRSEMADNRARELDWISGALMLFSAALVREIGPLDERFFLGGDDFDFCRRVRGYGLKVAYDPHAEAVHFHGYSSGGTGTYARIRQDMLGLDAYFAKNFPKKYFDRLAVRLMHLAKLGYLKAREAYHARPRKPIDATIAVTYQCNSRCRMCNIWQKADSENLDIGYLENLSRSLRYINITGGEPFLHPRIVQIISATKKYSPKAQIIISTNGLAADLIAERIREIVKIDPEVGVRVSIDGPEAVHDRIRGIDGIYSSAMRTIGILKQAGVKNLGLSFTVMDANVSEIRKVYDLSRELGVELALAMVQNSDIYFSKSDNRLNYVKEAQEGLDYIIAKELQGANPKRLARAFYDYGLIHYAKTGKRLLDSGAGFDSLFIDPTGAVFPSNLINLEMGNIATQKLDRLWNSDQARAVRTRIKKENIQESWIICTIRGEMKRNVLKVLGWIFRNKFLICHCESASWRRRSNPVL